MSLAKPVFDVIENSRPNNAIEVFSAAELVVDVTVVTQRV
jgi:hypothetical protein